LLFLNILCPGGRFQFGYLGVYLGIFGRLWQEVFVKKKKKIILDHAAAARAREH
jgi:hypothetical protein